MNPFIQVFSQREVYVPEYSHPLIDVLNDGGDPFAESLPDAPQIVSVSVGSVTWMVVEGADGYIIERLISGVEYQEIANEVAEESDESVYLVLVDAAVIAPGYYRVRAYNAAGTGLPSNSMFLESEEGGSSVLPPPV